jgi:hypothetical protein
MDGNTVTCRGLSAHTLKLIAIIAMLIDHTAWSLIYTQVHQINYTTGLMQLESVMHFFGRLTMPIMAFFVAEGFYHTKNKKKYALRLLLFALISQIPFTLMMTGGVELFAFNVMFTLMLGLLALWACRSGIKMIWKILIVTACCITAVPADWSVFGVLYVLAFGLNREQLMKQAIWFTAVSVGFFLLVIEWGNIWSYWPLGVFLPLPLLYLYNGKRGGDYPGSKWLFYIFYPAHCLILGLIRIIST